MAAWLREHWEARRQHSGLIVARPDRHAFSAGFAGR